MARLSETNKYTSKAIKDGGKFPQWNEKFTLVYNGENSLTIEVFHNNILVEKL